MATNKTEPNLIITRIFDAPRTLVWKTWTDPKHIAQWWGPHGFTNPLCEWDARTGGAILVHMRGPAGSAFDMIMPMKGVFREVAAPGVWYSPPLRWKMKRANTSSQHSTPSRSKNTMAKPDSPCR